MKFITEMTSFVTKRGPFDDEYAAVPIGDIQVWPNEYYTIKPRQKVKVTVILEFDDVH